jgi:hypothetical protein
MFELTWRYIAISLTDPFEGILSVNAWLHQQRHLRSVQLASEA